MQTNRNSTKKLLLAAAISTLMLWTLKSAPPIIVVRPPSPPPIIVTAPAPPVVVVAPQSVVPATTVTVDATPDSYVWDGTEYVGVVGSDYFYLGPDHVWLRLDAPRVTRFHDWERDHADWRTHATHNELYRNHERREEQHEQNRDRDHDRDHDHH